MTDEKKDEKTTKPSFVPFLRTGAEIHMSLKNSMDGKEKDEVVAAIGGMNEEDRNARVTGWRVRRKLYGESDVNDGSDSDTP